MGPIANNKTRLKSRASLAGIWTTGAIWQMLFFFLFLGFQPTALASSRYLSVISSANPESNSVHSFVIINPGEILREGIKHSTTQQLMGEQTPFVIEYKKPLKENIHLKWIIQASNKRHGTITLFSKHPGQGQLKSNGYHWESKLLDNSIPDRHKLVFRPKPFSHIPKAYKKGRGPKGKRTRYGGGTRKINAYRYNPKHAYDITLHIFRDSRRIFTHRTRLEMDYKDMIRQEYINHYNIKHYKDKVVGIMPIPMRNEISNLPPKPATMEGNPFTESQYNLVIDDGMLELTKKINHYYHIMLREVRAKGGLIDLRKKRRKVNRNKLWLSSGWRNPERNEWYSNTVNGNHQMGRAVDILIMAPSNSTQSALGYWVLWKTLRKYKNQINGFWQLEKNGVALGSREYWLDIEPRNGIPDAFDKADHLHANIKL